jgi:hypothetical protein
VRVALPRPQKQLARSKVVTRRTTVNIGFLAPEAVDAGTRRTTVNIGFLAPEAVDATVA